MTKQKTIVLTGASTGIGWDVARHLGQHGWHVLAGARKVSDIDRLAKLSGVEGIALDVTNSEHIANLVARIGSDGIDGLINNAGIAVGGPWELVPMEDLRRQFEVNVFGVAAVTQALLPEIRRRQGRIVNVSSISGRVAGAFIGPYAASKFALEAITDSLRREMSAYGVKVSSINPGPIDTPIWDKGILTSEAADKMYENDDQRQAYKRRIDKFIGSLAKTKSSASPTSSVTKAIVDALEQENPRSRYFVGPKMWFAAALSHLPGRMLDHIVK